MPVRVTFAIGGICHHVRLMVDVSQILLLQVPSEFNMTYPVAQILAASVRTMGVPRQPTPPYMFECESEATATVPGQAWPSSTIIW